MKLKDLVSNVSSFSTTPITVDIPQNNTIFISPKIEVTTPTLGKIYEIGTSLQGLDFLQSTIDGLVEKVVKALEKKHAFEIIQRTTKIIQQGLTAVDIVSNATEINMPIPDVMDTIYKILKDAGVVVLATNSSIIMMFIHALLVRMQQLIEECMKEDLTTSIEDIDIDWKLLTKQQFNYKNDFLLKFNDVDLLLKVNELPLSYARDFTQAITTAVRQVPVPILLVGASTENQKVNLPLLSLSAVGWHVEDITFNKTYQMNIRMRDFIVHGNLLHQYFERFIKQYVISDIFYNEDNYMQGMFIDEASVSFTLYLLTNMTVVKSISFLFLPLTIDLPDRNYDTMDISDFILSGLAIFYQNEDRYLSTI